MAQLTIGLERAMARGCGHVLGRPVKATGRWGTIIEQAIELTFVAYETGSLVQVYQIPAPPPQVDSFELEGSTLGELGAQVALSALGASALDYPDVAQVWLELSDEIGIGTRHEKLEVTQELGYGTRSATLDAQAREAIQDSLRESSLFALRHDQLVGVLVEADFEAMSARLRTASGDRIQISFDPGLSDDIHLALRHQASLLGEVRFNTSTATAVSVRVRSIKGPAQLNLALSAPAFSEHLSISELMRRQGTIAARTVDDIPHVDLPEADLAAALGAIES